jgi:REP element-mobilizing transposase RayT
MQFYDSDHSVKKYRRSLPHWSQGGAIHFVTFRLHDSLPLIKLQAIKEEVAIWRSLHPEPLSSAEVEEYAKRFTRKIHRWLDAGYGSCLLGAPKARDAMESVLRFFENERYSLGKRVIMPNHVHALIAPFPSYPLEAILHSWKSYSAKQVNAIFRRAGRVWQHESFDHIVRGPKQLERIERYIQNHPKIGRSTAGSDGGLE